MIVDNPLFTEEIPPKAIGRGHVRFNLKSRTPDDVALLGFCANVTASVLFERLQAQGTNIIISLNENDARVDVLARYENDGVNILWNPKPADPASLAQAQERIRNKTFILSAEQPKETHGEPARKTEELPIQQNATDKESMSEEEEDHLVKQLHRIP
jgi:hypothetical protein